MSIWKNAASVHGQSLEATAPEKVATPSGWTDSDSWKNKGILASEVLLDGAKIAKIMCTHLPPQADRSNYMRFFAGMEANNGFVTLTGDLNYRPEQRALKHFLGMKTDNDLDEAMAKEVSEIVLANKEDMRGGLVKLQAMSRLSPSWQHELQITCNSPAEAGILPTYARFYEDYEGQVACSCLDTGLQVTYAERLAALLSESSDLCHTALANATSNENVQRVFGDSVRAQAAKDVGAWCQSSDVNCLALLFYRCYIQNEINNGKIKTKQEKKTYLADKSTDGPMEVSAIGWLDRTCWHGVKAQAQELFPVTYGHSAYLSDHQPTATLLTLP